MTPCDILRHHATAVYRRRQTIDNYETKMKDMKLQSIRNFPTIEAYVTDKLERYSREARTMETLYAYMFDETDNTMTETTDGYRVRKTTYGEAHAHIEAVAPTLQKALGEIPTGSTVGLYAQNSPAWITCFWAILKCGYNVLLMNTRLPDGVLESVIARHGVAAVISDGRQFSVPTHTVDGVTAESEESLIPVPFGEEVTFMSSGTSERVKLCTYRGESFYHQVCDSLEILKHCPAIGNHYEGELKHLMLLPLCHVFGFIAVYLWFGFFSRTFVFPKDLNPVTVQNTVKKHKVTHIFAVPMVWEGVQKAATRKIASRGDKTYRKFQKVTRTVNRLGKSGDLLARKALREVREGLFGDSIQFLISGGSHISAETLAFFNGIGYHLANGYGMTELGITSVEFSDKRGILNTASIGAPFHTTEYRVDENGELLVKSKTRAARIVQGDIVNETNFDEWFATGDLAEEQGGRYYVKGRRDDLLIGPDGENINPVLAEAGITVKGVEQVCLFKAATGEITLLASLRGGYSAEALRSVHSELTGALAAVKLERAVNRVLMTYEPLLRGGEIKLSRSRIARSVASGEMATFDAAGIDRRVEERISGLEAEVRACFATALDRPADEIPTDAHFFNELGGTSLEYFALQSEIKTRFGLESIYTEGVSLFTVKDFTAYIRNH